MKNASESDLKVIADSIASGYTSGLIETENGSLSWSIDISINEEESEDIATGL